MGNTLCSDEWSEILYSVRLHRPPFPCIVAHPRIRRCTQDRRMWCGAPRLKALIHYSQYDSLELGKNERPIYPPKITAVRIVDNPFDDIVPRITAAEKQAQRLAKEEGIREREEAARRKGAKKLDSVLSALIHCSEIFQIYQECRTIIIRRHRRRGRGPLVIVQKEGNRKTRS